MTSYTEKTVLLFFRGDTSWYCSLHLWKTVEIVKKTSRYSDLCLICLRYLIQELGLLNSLSSRFFCYNTYVLISILLLPGCCLLLCYVFYVYCINEMFLIFFLCRITEMASLAGWMWSPLIRVLLHRQKRNRSSKASKATLPIN